MLVLGVKMTQLDKRIMKRYRYMRIYTYSSTQPPKVPELMKKRGIQVDKNEDAINQSIPD
jgi:hypothetical protein